ncbi:MAG: molybdopterin-guanine dinucleotide biosynthesis protein B [candidate division Zixibacteria bacterium]
MVELSIIGGRNSGKTTLTVSLISNLTKLGYHVISVKHCGGEPHLDQQGKDTFRHRAAGADLTVGISGTEMALFGKPGWIDIDKLASLMDPTPDICLIEGDRESGRPKLLITRELPDKHRFDLTDVKATVGPVRLSKIKCHFETDDIDGIVEFVSSMIPKVEAEAVHEQK